MNLWMGNPSRDSTVISDGKIVKGAGLRFVSNRRVDSGSTSVGVYVNSNNRDWLSLGSRRYVKLSISLVFFCTIFNLIL